MVSFDAFRSDYAERWSLENFLAVGNDGAAASSMIPSYPSKTFPNHYTLITGMYPGYHGLVDNTFINPAAGTYSTGNRASVENPDFYDGQPLWQLLQANGGVAAALFWIGSEAPINGSFPDFYRLYDDNFDNESRISQVLEWLSFPQEERPSLVTLYFSLVDSAAHGTGPDSETTRLAAVEADRLLGLLRNGLAGLSRPIDLIVLSDHGMYPIANTPESVIELASLPLGEGRARLTYTTTQAMLYVDDVDDVMPLYQSLKQRENHFTVYLKDETPPHWHYRASPNVSDIVIAAEPGYILKASMPSFALSPLNPQVGEHGYDARDVEELHGIFYAAGPHIREGVRIPPFENVHVFPLITKILGLPNPEGIDGSEDVLLPLYRD